MEISIEAFTRDLTGTIYYILNTSAPYDYLGEALWDWTDSEDITTVIDGVETTMRGEWSEPLPLDFGNDIVGVWVYSEICVVRKRGEKDLTVPTSKILHLLNLWLHFLRFAK